MYSRISAKYRAVHSRISNSAQQSLSSPFHFFPSPSDSSSAVLCSIQYHCSAICSSNDTASKSRSINAFLHRMCLQQQVTSLLEAYQRNRELQHSKHIIPYLHARKVLAIQRQCACALTGTLCTLVPVVYQAASKRKERKKKKTKLKPRLH